MQLLGHRILCTRIVEEKQTTSGLILPTNYQSEDEYKVVDIGVKVKHIKPGDRVRKFKYSDGLQVVDDGVEYLVLSEKDDVELIV
ncbi:chaperonin [Myroides odoratus]|uniref:Co-chaperonin GroES n=1 Tax=Myroides odoratus TaxID=256 RepID=A0A378RPX9_MYROD|nr:chaperonin [Myroides odoratus]QQU04243.1 chaperonin [Myroides odoratus]STZ28341.1 co-chaperonin GroES [Myroides odoratus]